jgi:NagD protein
LKPDRFFDAYIFDLDGTVYLGESLLPTAGETITFLRQHGKRTVFLSNNPSKTRGEYAAKLTRLGLATPAADVVNSSLVMVDFLRKTMPGATVFVVGEESLRRELAEAGFRQSELAAEVDAVIASFDRTFTYHKLQVAFDAIRAGARFFATNGDRYCPVPGGGEPDAAAMIAAIEACTQSQVEEIVGKPSLIMAQTVLDLVGVAPADCVMTGDRLETDVLMGLEAGMAAALTLTGATDAAAVERSSIRPTYILNGLADLLPR